MNAQDLKRLEDAKTNGWVDFPDGSRGHFVNGVLHNDRQAALIRPDGKGEWWRYGQPIGHVEDDADVSY